jgi:transposase
MLKLNAKWQETAEPLLQKSLSEPSLRLRERLLALHFVASGQAADKVARKIGRSRYALYDWIHNFNAKGIAGIEPKWKGNPGKLLSNDQLDALKEAVKQHPRELGIKKGRWTAMTVAAYVQKSFGIPISHDTARDYLRQLGFSYKKPASFHPQMVFLPNLSVNLRACLCGVVNYASAQALDFLDLGQKSSFLDWKHQKVPFFGKGLLWTGTS